MAKRPNVVFILADDMGYGDFGAFNPVAKTPALDGLMREGLSLTQHYSASCVCTPARAGFMTGRYPHRTGAIDMRIWRALDRISLRERTIGDWFRRCGYATGLIGKWHNGCFGEAYHPNARGFDEFVGFRNGLSPYFDWRLDRNGAPVPTDGRYLTDVFTDEAVQFLRRHREEPFFLFLAYNAPHHPLEAPTDEIEAFRDASDLNEAVRTLYAMVRHMDRGVATVLEELDRLGLAEDTLLVFTSDNGPQFGGQGERCTDRFNCGFAGSKGVVLEGGIRVPGIVRWPGGGLTGGRRHDGFAHFLDWLPTLVAAAGGGPEAELPLDGNNIMPELRGEAPVADPRRFWQWNRYTPLASCNAAMRDGQYKLVRPAIREAMRSDPQEMEWDRESILDPDRFTEVYAEPEPPRDVPPPPPPQLYDLEADPNEEHDLAASDPERVQRMSAEIDAWFESVEADRREATR